jgi:anti-anti-sigma regulatory factor
MTIRIENGSEARCRAIVDDRMTIYEAAADKAVLLEALAQAREAEIDLSSVREMDTAGLQILILLKREALKAGKVVRLVGCSPASFDVLERYGLATYFGEPAGNAARDPVVVASRCKKRDRATARVKARGRRAR